MARILRLVGVSVVLEVLLQVVVARAHVALWLFLVSAAHLQAGSAAVAIVIPDVLMQGAVAFAVAGPAGVRSRTGALVVVGVTGALAACAAALVPAALRPHAWQVLTSLVITCGGAAAGLALRLRTSDYTAGSRGSASADRAGATAAMTYGDARPTVAHTRRGQG